MLKSCIFFFFLSQQFNVTEFSSHSQNYARSFRLLSYFYVQSNLQLLINTCHFLLQHLEIFLSITLDIQHPNYCLHSVKRKVIFNAAMRCVKILFNEFVSINLMSFMSSLLLVKVMSTHSSTSKSVDA